MTKRLVLISAALLLTTGVPSFAEDTSQIEAPVIQYPMIENSYKSQNYQDDKLSGNVVMVPANTTFTAVLITPLSSETSKTGDSVSLYLNSDFYYGNNLIAPEGSKVNGTVVKVKKGKYANIDGLIQVRFTNLVTPAGLTIPISASIETDDKSGVLKAGTYKDAIVSYSKTAVVGTGAGAVLGTIGGAIGGDVGKGALIGTAVGGGASVIKMLADKGDDVSIPENSQMNVILEQPVTFSADTPY